MTGKHQSWIRRAIGVFGVCLIGVAGSPAAAQSVVRTGQPVPCENLASLSLPDTRVTRAERVSAGTFKAPASSTVPIRADYTRLPAFCRVAATIAPTPDSAIKMEIWMPVDGWNGKFVGVGNGGFSGEIWYVFMVDPLSRGYAVAGTDTGHEGDGADASFAVGHPEKLVDYAWRAVHEMTLKSKAIIAQHYGTMANRSYWMGCSSGGRQGLKEAQRFPGDYDVISAGAPASHWVPLMAYAAKVQGLITDPSSGIPPPGLNLLKEAAIAACDARDGVTDRVVEDPRSCHFDPGTLQCSAGSSTNCLTARQVETARSIYAGVVNPRTRETIFPGPAPGGEPAWSAFSPKVFPIGANYWRDLVMGNPNWSVASLDFDADVARARTLDTAELTTTNADLRPFFARGGKLLLWHGWTDGLIPAQSTIDYYQSVLGTTGPDANASMRLFMLPGVDHCADGEGTYMMDALGVMDAWVENKQPPDRIVARRPLQGGTLRTRPLCPYPQVARYRGQGSTDDERNFECRAPAAR
jgi:feruloyl esterase